jgi:hypothetical protein
MYYAAKDAQTITVSPASPVARRMNNTLFEYLHGIDF